MNIDELIKTEHLCNIKVEKDKKETLLNQINEILESIKKIYDIEITEKPYRPAEIKTDRLRDDFVVPFEDKRLLSNTFINKEDGFVIVPKIIGGKDDN